MNPIYQQAQFLMSAPELRALPRDIEREVAFAGRSNAGKSSALNAITQRRALARTSKTPGRTQHINVFPLDETRALIDLPGYGYAKVHESMREHWRRALPEYLAKRDSLRGLMLIMDARHPLTPYDCELLDWCRGAKLPVHVLLTKADKLSRGAAGNTLQTVRKVLREEYPQNSAQLFSAPKRLGVDEAHAKLDEWLFGTD